MYRQAENITSTKSTRQKAVAIFHATRMQRITVKNAQSTPAQLSTQFATDRRSS